MIKPNIFPKKKTEISHFKRTHSKKTIRISDKLVPLKANTLEKRGHTENEKNIQIENRDGKFNNVEWEKLSPILFQFIHLEIANF